MKPLSFPLHLSCPLLLLKWQVGALYWWVPPFLTRLSSVCIYTFGKKHRHFINFYDQYGLVTYNCFYDNPSLTISSLSLSVLLPFKKTPCSMLLQRIAASYIQANITQMWKPGYSLIIDFYVLFQLTSIAWNFEVRVKSSLKCPKLIFYAQFSVYLMPFHPSVCMTVHDNYGPFWTKFDG